MCRIWRMCRMYRMYRAYLTALHVLHVFQGSYLFITGGPGKFCAGLAYVLYVFDDLTASHVLHVFLYRAWPCVHLRR